MELPKGSKKSIIFAAGGTGGHLFPAQALARLLSAEDTQLEVLFVGSLLRANRCLNKELFAFQEISAAHLSRSPWKLLKAILSIVKGIGQSLRILKKEQPQLIIGFGSYHSFPLLVSALLRGIPILLFESDLVPGRVNRLFSRWASLNAVQFAEAGKALKGKSVQVDLPIWQKEEKQLMKREEALLYFGFATPSQDPPFTFLVFGGSLGALFLNRIFCEVAGLLREKQSRFQVIHITGRETCRENVEKEYERLKIPASVREFEEKMHFAWRAADLAICRAGAGTLAEILAFEVPAILIPYPHATHNHQKINALFMEQEIKGGVCLDQTQLTTASLLAKVEELWEEKPREKMKMHIHHFKQNAPKEDLLRLIRAYL